MRLGGVGGGVGGVINGPANVNIGANGFVAKELLAVNAKRPERLSVCTLTLLFQSKSCRS